MARMKSVYTIFQNHCRFNAILNLDHYHTHSLNQLQSTVLTLHHETPCHNTNIIAQARQSDIYDQMTHESLNIANHGLTIIVLYI